MSEPELTNKYRDNLKIDALRADVDAIKVDLTNFVVHCCNLVLSN